jgi:glycosyltransferase involved in cell wall biosynthesis
LANRNPGLSVAIATLDRPEGLARCLDALQAGTTQPAEIIVIDQSAGDETERLLAYRRAGLAPIRYVQQPRRGLSASRNAGLRLASQPLVAMTDDDCAPGNRWVEAIVGAFAPAEVSAVSGRVLPLGPETPGTYAVSSRLSQQPALYASKVPPWLAGSGGNFAVRRAVWQHLGGFDERLGAGTRGQSAEDMDFIYRMLAAGKKIAYEPDAVIYHERQDLGRRMASRWSYGYGMGAACGKWLRRRDLYALRLLGGWLLWRSRGLLEAARNGHRQAVSEHSLMLRGTLAGLGYGLRLEGDA